MEFRINEKLVAYIDGWGRYNRVDTEYYGKTWYGWRRAEEIDDKYCLRCCSLGIYREIFNRVFRVIIHWHTGGKEYKSKQVPFWRLRSINVIPFIKKEQLGHIENYRDKKEVLIPFFRYYSI